MPLGMPLIESEQSNDKPLIPKQYRTVFCFVTGLFFLWGVPNNLNDVLIRQFMKSFEISRLLAGFVQFAFYLGYFFVSIPAANLMRRFGYKAGLVTGLLLYSFGTFLFYPAALAGSYSLFLIALFVIASGLGFLETGANPFIAQLGDPESSVRRLTFSQAFNPLGAITGVLIGVKFIFSGVELKAEDVAQMKLAGTYQVYLQHETMRVIAPYMVLGIVVLIWAFFLFRTPFPAIAAEQSSGLDKSGSDKSQGSYRNLLLYPQFLLAVFAQFCYVGAQIGTWSYFIQYVQDYTHQPEKIAGYFLTGTLVGFGVGRFSASALMKVMSSRTLLGLFAIINIVLVAVGILFPGWVGLWAIFLTSFFMSLMFPTIFALGLEGLGENTKAGASLLVMAIIGGAVFTPAIGLLFQVTKSMATAMVIPLVCYVCVAFYAFWWSKIQPRMTPLTAEG